MKGRVRGAFSWSWLLTLPVVVFTAFWLMNTASNFWTFNVRYNSWPETQALSFRAENELQSLYRILRLAARSFESPSTGLPIVDVYVAEADLAELDGHLPQSGFRYVSGALLSGEKLQKVKYRYRGDYIYHWGWQKKSVRIKTKKDQLFHGLRAFNLQAPKFSEQLNNWLSLQLADFMGLVNPRTEMVRLRVNGRDRGVYILVEQLEELTLRHRGLMPGDVYRGEMAGKDAFTGFQPGTNLFDRVGFWDKIAVNNHYDESEFWPLAKLLELLSERDAVVKHDGLSKHLDIEEWGRFSAFETIASTKHYHNSHNWRIYYDPWRQKLIPIVWDPVGWASGWRVKTESDSKIRPIISNRIMESLFQNGDFLRAREHALETFFMGRQSNEFLSFVDKTSLSYISESRSDRYLRPAKAGAAESSIESLREYIRQEFIEGKGWASNRHSATTYAPITDGLRFVVTGDRSVKRIRLRFDEDLPSIPALKIVYQRVDKFGRLLEESISPEIEVKGSQLTFSAGFLADHEVLSDPNHGVSVVQHTSTYDVHYKFAGVSPSLVDVMVEEGEVFRRLAGSSEIPEALPFRFTQRPVIRSNVSTPVTWEGVKTISGATEVLSPVVIKPGTTVILEENASLIFRNRVTAVGTPAAPIQFKRFQESDDPWGAVVLIGPLANGSRFEHCAFSGGSGYKQKLFEYSGMFSVHDVDGVSVRHCKFRDGSIVDDMVHVVYSTIQFEYSQFNNAFSDALDIDISEAVIRHSKFTDSGNDAVDLMSSTLSIDNSSMISSGDKGISVGEGSKILSVNNRYEDNGFGAQVKDGSEAYFFNDTFRQNANAIDAYKKNWRYDGGGEIYVAKTKFLLNPIVAKADKHSAISVFDSYSETTLDGLKRIHASSVDGKRPFTALFPNDFAIADEDGLSRISNLSDWFDLSTLELMSAKIRGASE